MIKGCSYPVSSELAAAAGATAHWLREQGADDDRKPLAVVSRSPTLLGLLSHVAPALGLALFPIDPALPDAQIGELLAQAGCARVISERTFPGVQCIEPGAMPTGSAPSLPACRLADHDIALLIATSGSSGHPRAVMLTAGNLHASARAAATRTPLLAGDRWLGCLPLFHIGGYAILVRCALAGAEAVLLDGFDAQQVADTLHVSHITHLSLVPAMLAQLLEVIPGRPPPSLRHLLVGGAALPGELAERAVTRGWPIQPTYGMSETASQIATLPHLTPPLTLPWTPGLVGRPLPGVEIRIDADQRLRVRGPMLMAGYANPANNPGEGLEDGWLLTADRARLSDAGELVILGRADGMIISGGKKIAPEAVEDRLLRCPGIREVAVAGRPDPVWGERVTAIYSGEIGERQLLDWCRTQLAAGQRPRTALRVATLPRLTNGKPDRQKLRRLTANESVI